MWCHDCRDRQRFTVISSAFLTFLLPSSSVLFRSIFELWFQLLFGAYGGISAAAMAAVTQARILGRSSGSASGSSGGGGSLVHVGVLDEVAVLVGWELLSLLCGGFLAVVWLDAACRERCNSGSSIGGGSSGAPGTTSAATARALGYALNSSNGASAMADYGIGLPSLFGCPPTPLMPSSTQKSASATGTGDGNINTSAGATAENEDNADDDTEQKDRSSTSTPKSDFGESTRLCVTAHVAAGLLVLALERRVALPFLQRWLVVGGAAGACLLGGYVCVCVYSITSRSACDCAFCLCLFLPLKKKKDTL